MIEARNVFRQFAGRTGMFSADRIVRAVDGVSFNLESGGVLGIVGESGCGKSTLGRMILGLLPPTSGDILVEGRSLADLDRRERARLIQPVFQDPFSSLNPRHRVRDIVGLPLAAQGTLPAAKQRDAVMDMLVRVGLPASMAERFPAQLSGGQRQRVAIARALVLRPRIVVCDEPTSALDVSVQAQILNLLADLRRELGLTYVFISHNLAVVEHVATEVAVMYLGRFVEHAPSEDLFREPPPSLYPRLAGIGVDGGTRHPDPGRGIGRHVPRPGQHPRGMPVSPALPHGDRPLPNRHADRNAAQRQDHGVPFGRLIRISLDAKVLLSKFSFIGELTVLSSLRTFAGIRPVLYQRPEPLTHAALTPPRHGRT